MDLRGVPVNQVIIKQFVIRVIEADRLQPRFQVPINFPEKQKIRLRFFDGLDRIRPELVLCRRGSAVEFLPRLGKDLV